MKRNAMRRPSPVLRIPRERKNAQSTSQTIGSEYPLSDFAGESVFVSAIVETPRKTTAPAGTGRTIEPTIVAVKIARRRHDSGVIPAGTGNSSTKTADPTTASQRLREDMRAEYTA